VSTSNARVLFSTKSYNGGIVNVAVYTTSNVVVSDTPSNNVVLYATGTINAKDIFVSTATATALSVSGTATIGTLNVSGTTSCNGLKCRVHYSSGTESTFSVVFVASKTYEWHFALSQTSGSTTADIPQCTINSDSTATNYFQHGNPYPNNYAINNNGAAAKFNFCFCGGGTNNGTDSCVGKFTLSTPSGVSTRLQAEGGVSVTCQNLTLHNDHPMAFLYKGAATTFTMKCDMSAAGFGWKWENTVYEVGK
jgi:hypothetical protein